MDQSQNEESHFRQKDVMVEVVYLYGLHAHICIATSIWYELPFSYGVIHIDLDIEFSISNSNVTLQYCILKSGKVLEHHIYFLI